MGNKRLEEIEKIKDDIPEINITPTAGQAVLIFVSFFSLALLVTYLAESV